MPEPLVYLHGQFVPQSQAFLTLHDAGFVMGVTVTDLCRTVRHQLYRWNEHRDRFLGNCDATELRVSLTSQELGATAAKLVEYNSRLIAAHQDLALVLFATPGPIGYYLGEAGAIGEGPVTFGMHTFPIPFERYRPLIERGAILRIPSIRQIPPDCIDPRIKQRSRMHWWLADREVRKVEPGAMAILLDAAGNLTETAAANLAVVKDGIVCAAPEGTVLEGVSLGIVRELCESLKLSFVRRPISREDVLAADEVFLTSTIYSLAHVARFEGHNLPARGPVFERVLSAWNAQAGFDFHEQIVREVKDLPPAYSGGSLIDSLPPSLLSPDS